MIFVRSMHTTVRTVQLRVLYIWISEHFLPFKQKANNTKPAAYSVHMHLFIKSFVVLGTICSLVHPLFHIHALFICSRAFSCGLFFQQSIETKQMLAAFDADFLKFAQQLVEYFTFGCYSGKDSSNNDKRSHSMWFTKNIGVLLQ